MTAFTPEDIAQITATADALADAARAAILPFFRAAHLKADTKQSAVFDPVTQADHAAEEAMRAILAAHRPDDGIHGESSATMPGRPASHGCSTRSTGRAAFCVARPHGGC